MILSVDAKNAMLQGLAAKLNVGTNSTLAVYIGATLAAELTMANPVEASIINGVLTFKKPVDALAIASGLPTAAKLLSAAGVVIAELDIATEVTLNKDKIYQGGYVGISSLTIRI